MMDHSSPRVLGGCETHLSLPTSASCLAVHSRPLAGLGIALWSRAYFPFSEYNVQSLYPSLVLKSVSSARREPGGIVWFVSLRVCLIVLLAEYYRSRSQNSLLWYGQCCSPPLGQLHPASRDRKLWMEGPLLPKRPYPDLLHTPRETKESPGPYHSPTSPPSSPEVCVAGMV